MRIFTLIIEINLIDKEHTKNEFNYEMYTFQWIEDIFFELFVSDCSKWYTVIYYIRTNVYYFDK